MAVRAPGDYDPNTGWPPDDSTGVNWQNDVDLPGQFGPGGFRASPKLTAPASGPPPGMSLAAPGSNWDPRNWFKADPNATFEAGKPMGEIAAGGAVPSILGGGGNPYWRGAIAAGGVLTPTPAETGEFNPAMITGRPDAPLPLHMPHRPVTPTPGAAPMPARPVTPTPSTAYPAPAATRQRPNLGAYGAPPAAVANSPFTTFDRPNMSPQNSMQGRQGDPQMGMLDLSRLFSGGQPAPVAAAPLRSVTTSDPTRGPPITPGLNPSGNLVLAGGNADPRVMRSVPVPYPPVAERPRKDKSSSTSQGGGY